VHTRFSASSSNTYVKNGTLFNITYGSGGVSGYFGTDTVGVGNLAAKSVSFGLTTVESGTAFLASKFDGICGLAYQSISVNGEIPLFQYLINQGQVSDPSFSFYLTNSADEEGSALILGGTDSAYYTGSL